MTPTAELVDADVAALKAPKESNGWHMLMVGLQRLVGCALTLAALGIWLAPGASWESDIMLFKLVLSLCALLAGVGMMQASATSLFPAVEIDTIRREVRLTRRAAKGAAQVLRRCTFAEMSRAERIGNKVRMWDSERRLLAEVRLSDRKIMQSLLAGLRDAGKLA